MTTVREINDPAELAPLRPAWEALVERTAGASFAHTLDWLSIYWKHYGADKRLRVLVVYDDADLVGILPLAVWKPHPGEPKALTFPLDYWGDQYGPLGPNPGQVLAAGFDHIRRTARDWQMIELAWIDGLNDEERTPAALEAAGFPAVCDRAADNALVDLTAFASWDAYCASHNSKWRYNLRRWEKKLAERGKITYLRHRRAGDSGPPRWDLYEACETISRASWQGSAPGGTMLTKEADRGFFRECFALAHPHAGVDLDLLFVGERPAAFGYRFYYRGRVTAIKVAYDLDFASEGAGTVLLGRSIEESFARGDHTIELSDEFLGYKKAWLTHLRPVYRYVYFRPRISAQVVRGKRALVRRLRPLVHKWRSGR
jgi:hypothetical protein